MKVLHLSLCIYGGGGWLSRVCGTDVFCPSCGDDDDSIIEVRWPWWGATESSTKGRLFTI